MLPADSEKQEFVRWLNNYGYGTDRPYEWRVDLWKFVGEKKDEDGRDLSLSSNPEERGEILHFMEIWEATPAGPLQGPASLLALVAHQEPYHHVVRPLLWIVVFLLHAWPVDAGYW